MKKTDLIDALADNGLSKSQANAAVDTLVNAVTHELARGGEVRLTGFGTFGVSKRGARTARNPQTGETVKVAARKVPVFRAGATLKQAVNG